MKKTSLFLLAVTACLSGFSQDPIFLSSNQSLLYLNPSFAGSNGLIRSQALARQQWPQLSAPYTTYYTAVDARIKNSGLAYTNVYDNVMRGAMKSITHSLIYAHYFSLMDKKLKITPSLQASYISRQLDKSMISFGDVIDPRFGYIWNMMYGAEPVSKKANLDVSSGLLINYGRFYFGAALFHMNQPNVGLLGDYILPRKLQLHSAYNFKLNEKSLLHALARYDKQGDIQHLSVQANLLFARYCLVGAGYRWNNTRLSKRNNEGSWAYPDPWNQIVNASLGVRTNFFTFTVGVDAGLPEYANNFGPVSFETQLSFSLRDKERRRAITDLEAW